MSGLFWLAGPIWAADAWCLRLGEVAEAAVVAREAGVPLETALTTVEQVAMTDAVRRAVRANTYAGYEGAETAAQARQRAIRICQEAAAQVEADVRAHR